jgi:hypothetical protein
MPRIGLLHLLKNILSFNCFKYIMKKLVLTIFISRNRGHDECQTSFDA